MTRPTDDPSQPTAPRRAKRPRTSNVEAVLLGLAAAIAGIVLFQKALGWDEDCGASFQTNITTDNDDRVKVRIRSGRCTLSATLGGDVRFAESEDEIVFVGPRSYLKLEAKTEEGEHRLEATPGETPEAPEIEYARDGEEMALDAEGKKWLREVALVLFRRAGIDAEKRSERIWRRGGIEALVEEVDAIRSDTVAAKYLRPAFEEGDAAAVTMALAALERGVSSDFVVARVLVFLAERRDEPGLLDGALRDQLAETLSTVGSDFEVSRVLRTYLAAPLPDAATQESLLAVAATTLGSDFEAAQVLVALAEALPADAPLPPASLRLLDSVGSDFEIKRTVEALLDGGRSANDAANLVSLAARHIGSDWEMSELLVVAASAVPPERRTPEVEAAVERGLESIGGDHARRRAEDAWHRSVDRSAPVVDEAVVDEAVESESADFEEAEEPDSDDSTPSDPET